MVVPDFKTEERFVVNKVLKRQAVASGMSTCLYHDGMPVGALLVHSMRHRDYDEYARRVLEHIATQTTTALGARRLFEAGEERRKEQAHAIEHALRVINQDSRGLNAEEIFVRILERAVTLTEQKAHIATMHRYDAEAFEIILEAIYPAPLQGYQQTLLGKKWSINFSYQDSGKIGVTGRAIKERKPQLVPNVSKDNDYINLSGLGDIRSEMVVPLLDGREVLGVINLESKISNAFTSEHTEVVEALAQMIVIVMRKVRDSEAMKKTMTQLNARTALVWMGMVNNHWLHDHDITVNVLRQHLDLAKDDLNKHFGGSIPVDIVRRLQLMEGLVNRQRPSTPRLTAEEGIVPVRINDLLRERASQLWENLDFRGDIKLELHMHPEEESTIVRASQEWLISALDLIIDNAVKELKSGEVPLPRRLLKLFTRPARRGVEIVFRDYGRGIPANIRDKILTTRIEKRAGDPGLGIGMLMARIIVETYGGELRIGEPLADGTEVIMWFPRS